MALKYIAIADELREMITAGEYAPGQLLPTESALVKAYSVSRQTVRQALSLLVEEGLIESKRGSGSYVREIQESTPVLPCVAVITTYISNYIFPMILRSIEQEVASHSATMMLFATNNSSATERKILKSLSQTPIRGIIVEGTKAGFPNPNLAYYRRLADSGIPIVFIHSCYPQLEHDRIVSVQVQDYQGGKQLAKWLIDKGCTKIGGIFKGDDAQGQQRYAGVVDAILENGLEFQDCNFQWFTTESSAYLNGQGKSAHIFQSCDGIICYNDEIAERLPVLIPDIYRDLKAIGSFDRMIDGVPGFEKNFASLDHPKEELGRIAANKLFRMMDGKLEHSTSLPWGVNDSV